MKYISIILMSLFIVGNVSAKSTLKDVCNWAKNSTIKTYDDSLRWKDSYIKAEQDRQQSEEIKKRMYNTWQAYEDSISKWAKVYHYLDCSRFGK